jgi:7-cyano-7-deazaguanine reductase
MNQKILKTLDNKNNDKDFICEHNTDELTSVCPQTKFPDFYSLRLIYQPDKYLIELKSLKFYLADYRNIEIYHEELLNQIFEDLKIVIQPKWILICMKVNIRGGIRTIIKRSWIRSEEK